MSPVDGNDPVARLIACFDQFAVPYMIVGSLSSNAYGIPTPEDVVIQKLRWGRPRDLSDVGDVVAVQNESLDHAYIQRWTEAHGTTGEWMKILAGL